MHKELLATLQWCQSIRNNDDKAKEWIMHSQSLPLPYSLEITKLAYRKLAMQLFLNGFVVFPIYSKAESKQKVQEFQQAEREFREYNHDVPFSKQNPYVLGGFGAYGNPSSFHNRFSREVREEKIKHIPLLGELMKLAEEEGIVKDARAYKVAEFMDRMCKRIAGTSTTKESYHTDLIPKARSTDFTIGGWIQLSSDTSYFSCIPKTHTFFLKKASKGFATEKKECTDDIPIPQGHMLMFFQNLGHCVYATKKKIDSYRVFSVFLLTTHDTHIYDYTTILKENGVPRLASHQCPPMYSANHASFWLSKMTIPWSHRVFKKRVLVTRKKKDGTTYEVVESPMKSLQHYGFKLYPPYKEWEKKLFVPAQRFEISNGQVIDMFM